MEVASFPRACACSATAEGAARRFGSTGRHGYVKGPDDAWQRSDARVGPHSNLIFRKFAELGQRRQVYFWLVSRQIQLRSLAVRRCARDRLAAARVSRGAQRIEEPDLRRGLRDYDAANDHPLDAGQNSGPRQVRPPSREGLTVLIMESSTRGYIDGINLSEQSDNGCPHENARRCACEGPVNVARLCSLGLRRCRSLWRQLLANSRSAA